MNTIKILAVGDDGVGKSGIFEGNKSSSLSIYQKYEFNISHDENEYKIQAWDIAGQEEYNPIRFQTYKDMDIIVVCFSLVHPPSFGNVLERWYEELQEYCPNKPIILVGTKLDLVDDTKTLEKLKENQMTPVTHDEVVQTAKEIHAYSFIEISAYKNIGLKNIYEQIVEAYETEILKKEKKVHL